MILRPFKDGITHGEAADMVARLLERLDDEARVLRAARAFCSYVQDCDALYHLKTGASVEYRALEAAERA